MKKKLPKYLGILIVIWLFYSKTIAQTFQVCEKGNQWDTNIDTLDLIYKAKLLTLISYGIPPRDTVIDVLTGQHHSLIYSASNPSIVLIKIQNRQTIFSKFEGGYYGFSYIRELCNYFILYSCTNMKFYLMGGFIQDDFLSFYHNLNKEICIDYLIEEKNFEILKCYYQKYILKGRYKKNTCNICCSEGYDNNLY